MTWTKPARFSILAIFILFAMSACAPAPSASTAPPPSPRAAASLPPTAPAEAGPSRPVPAAMMADSASLPRFDISGLDLKVQPDSARVSFTSLEPGFCNVLIGSTPGEYTRMVTESMPGAPHTAHVNEMRDLKPGTTYHFRVLFTNVAAGVAMSAERTFTTPPAVNAPRAETQPVAPASAPTQDAPVRRNLALMEAGARITGVSSNYGGTANEGMWGANAAIDGDPATEWSANGDGNGAWIEIALPHPETVRAVGFQTRTMGTSAEVRSIRVRSGEGMVLGPFQLTGPDRMDVFPLDSPVTSDRFRFEVVHSTGGNTGAREIGLFDR